VGDLVDDPAGQDRAEHQDADRAAERPEERHRRDDLDPIWRERRRHLRRHPALAAYRMAAFRAVERELAAEVARRIPDDPDAVLRARVLVARLGGALRVAEEHRLDGSARPLAAIVRDALAYAATP